LYAVQSKILAHISDIKKSLELNEDNLDAITKEICTRKELKVQLQNMAHVQITENQVDLKKHY